MLDVRRLGRLSYDEGLKLQAELVEQRRAGSIPDTLLLLEHPPVITLGVKTRIGPKHIVATPEQLSDEGVTVHETGRGGDVTYHGPGQLVGYPILDLAAPHDPRKDVHHGVRDIEEVLIQTAASFGIDARRVAGSDRRVGRTRGTRREARGHRHPHQPVDHQPRLCVVPRPT